LFSAGGNLIPFASGGQVLFISLVAVLVVVVVVVVVMG
jgi:hypothetical protein